MSVDADDLRFLDRAARWAVRGHGLVEPNPMVGCVISDATGVLITTAAHQRFGAEHAEVLALQRAGTAARHGTVYVTLEPCTHQGKTPPCVDALVKSGISRVVIGSPDPNPKAGGGGAHLESSGLQVDFANHEPSARLIAPFRTRMEKGRPWITVKWAQTLDGRIATRTGDSRWISSTASRKLVHRERGRVDAILTGIGTVLKDDPRLTARGVRRRRIATRIVLDRSLRTPVDAALLKTLDDAPLVIVTDEARLDSPKASELKSRGATLLGRRVENDRFDLPSLMQYLLDSMGFATILVEAGRGLMSDLVQSGCADELAVFIAPTIMADSQGLSPLNGNAIKTMSDVLKTSLIRDHRRDGDVLLRYWLEK